MAIEMDNREGKLETQIYQFSQQPSLVDEGSESLKQEEGSCSYPTNA